MVHLNGHTLKLLVLHLTGEEDLFMVISIWGKSLSQSFMGKSAETPVLRK
jgi:hypothetical protein